MHVFTVFPASMLAGMQETCAPGVQEAARAAGLEKGAREAAGELRRELQTVQERLLQAQQQRYASAHLQTILEGCLCALGFKFHPNCISIARCACQDAGQVVLKLCMLCRDEAVSEAERAADRANRAESMVSSLQAQRSRQNDLSEQLSTLVKQNEQLASQLQTVTAHSSQVKVRPGSVSILLCQPIGQGSFHGPSWLSQKHVMAKSQLDIIAWP